MTSLETKVNQLTTENAALTNIIRELKASLHQERIDHAATKRQHTLMGLGLSENSIARLNAAFAKSTDNAGLKQAINAERRMPATKQDARVERILGGAQ